MSSLCDICSDLDIKRLLTSPDSNEETELGSFEEIEERSRKCELCKIILSAIRYGPWAYRGKLGEEDGFVLVPVWTVALQCKCGQDEDPVRAYRLHIYTDEFEDAGDVMLDAEDSHHIKRPGIGYGRRVAPETISYEVVKHWISTCEKNHEECNATYRSVQAAQQLPEQSLLIDVKKHCLVQAPKDANYAALSYKWGDAKQYLTLQKEFSDLQIEGALACRPLPATVRDAITLTREIGLDYVWVDALCIIQDSATHKAAQIGQMHLVYGCAAVTIVAASSADANDGMAGVSGKPRDIVQASTTIDGLRLLPRTCFLGRIMNGSEYNTRAWTYQESSLARRILYVTSRGVSMLCCTTLCSEEIKLENDECDTRDCQKHSLNMATEQRNIWREFIGKQRKQKSTSGCTEACKMRVRQSYNEGELPNLPKPTHTAETKDWSGTYFSACEDCLAFNRRSEAEWLMYLDAVRSYTHRQMRFESDRLPAFAGIAGILADQYDTKFLFGLPEKYLELALLWAPRKQLSQSCRRDGLRGIPSWSWASHEISAGYSGDNWLTTEVDWYRAHDDEIKAVHSLKTYGTHALLRKDFHKPVTLLDLEKHGLLPLDDTALYGWVQSSSDFFLKDLQVHTADQKPVTSALGYVRFSDVPPKYDLEYQPVEVVLLSRSSHTPIQNVYDENWDLQSHTINLVVVERDGNTVRRLAKADINDVKAWKAAKKEWKLVKFI